MLFGLSFRKMNRFCRFWVFVIAAFAFTACRPHDKYPVEPAIEFISLEKISEQGNDKDVRLAFSFKDGDGDIGLDDDDLYPPFDTSSLFYYNCFISYFEKQNGEFVEVELPLPLNMRIPRLSKEASESIEGEIYLDLYAVNPFSRFDTIRYELFIVDRALNFSNVITTSEFVVNKKKLKQENP